MNPIASGGCAPPVYVETERQRDQRVADALRAQRRAEADGRLISAAMLQARVEAA